MKKEEIEQAANEFHKRRFKSEELSRLEVSGYIQGLIDCNERQPYTIKDLSEFAEWLGLNGWMKHTEIKDLWFRHVEVIECVERKTTSQLIEMWEIEKGRREK